MCDQETFFTCDEKESEICRLTTLYEECKEKAKQEQSLDNQLIFFYRRRKKKICSLEIELRALMAKGESPKRSGVRDGRSGWRRNVRGIRQGSVDDRQVASLRLRDQAINVHSIVRSYIPLILVV